MSEFKLKLGDEVKDVLSGFQGVITNKSHWLFNMDTYGVKPRELKDGKPVDSMVFDEERLEIVQEGVIPHPNDDPEFLFNLGDKVRDTISGYEGVVISQTYWLTNCVHYSVQAGKLDDKGEPVKHQHFPEPQLQLIKETEQIKDEDGPGGPVPSFNVPSSS